MVAFSIDRGRSHGVRVADVVASVAREANVPGAALGAIRVERAHTTLDVDSAFAPQVLRRLRNGVRVRGEAARLIPVGDMHTAPEIQNDGRPFLKPSHGPDASAGDEEFHGKPTEGAFLGKAADKKFHGKPAKGKPRAKAVDGGARGKVTNGKSHGKGMELTTAS